MESINTMIPSIPAKKKIQLKKTKNICPSCGRYLTNEWGVKQHLESNPKCKFNGICLLD